MSSSVHWNHNFPQIARESGFRLKQPTGGKLDWGLIGSIDVDWLIRENDLDGLESVQSHLSAPLSSPSSSSLLAVHSVDGGSVVKFCELAQLSVQFLLFCKQFLDQSVTTLRNNYSELRRKNEKLERLCKRRNEELLLARQQPRGTMKSRTLVCPKCCKDELNFNGMEIEKTKKKTTPSEGPVEESKSLGQCSGGGGIYAREENQEDNRNTADHEEENRSQRIEHQDINLINAIKLELEVKHLRARLAEVEMERRRPEKGLAMRCFSCQQPPPEELDEQVICEGKKEQEKELEGLEKEKEQQLHLEQPKRDVGVQIDGISIVHQTEKASVIVGSGSNAEPTAAVAFQEAGPGNKKWHVDGGGGGGGEERLMALVQEQLSKALEQWTRTTAVVGLSEKKQEDSIKPRLEKDQVDVDVAPSPSIARLRGLSLKPTEIISIVEEKEEEGDLRILSSKDQPSSCEMWRVFQEQLQSMQAHWEAKYSQFVERGNVEQQPQPTHNMTDERVYGESEPTRMCRQPLPVAESKETTTCPSVSAVDREIDKNELLMPQVGGINAENCWQPLVPGGPHHQSAKRVQLRSPSSRTTSNISSPRGDSSSTNPDDDDEPELGDEAEDYFEESGGNNLLSTTTTIDANRSNPIDSGPPVVGGSSAVPLLERNGPEVNEEGVRRKVISELNDRLLDMGIRAKRKGIARDALNTATCRLTDNRDLSKSKWSKFFVIRRRVVAQVNGLVAARRLSGDQKIIQEVLRREVKHPMMSMMVPPSCSMAIESSRDPAGTSSGCSLQQQSLHVKLIPGKRVDQELGGGAGCLSSNLVTMFNRIPDTDDDCFSDGQGDEKEGAAESSQTDSIAGSVRRRRVKESKMSVAQAPIDEPKGRQKEVVEVEVSVLPKPLPRKVLFNFSENNRKLGSLESLESKGARIG